MYITYDCILVACINIHCCTPCVYVCIYKNYIVLCSVQSVECVCQCICINYCVFNL